MKSLDSVVFSFFFCGTQLKNFTVLSAIIVVTAYLTLLVIIKVAVQDIDIENIDNGVNVIHIENYRIYILTIGIFHHLVILIQVHLYHHY